MDCKMHILAAFRETKAMTLVAQNELKQKFEIVQMPLRMAKKMALPKAKAPESFGLRRFS